MQNHVDVDAILDRRKLGLPHLVTLVVCALVMACDGFDLYMLGMLAPSIAEGLRVPVEALAMVFAGQSAGAAVGAFCAGPIADRLGRKWPFIMSILLFGIGTLLVLEVTTLNELIVLRVLTGVLLGGVMPMATSLVSEAMPKRFRATSVTLIFTGYVLGTSGGAIMAKWLLEPYGWRIGFWVAGLVALATLPIVLFAIPESLRYLASRRPQDPRVRRMVQRASPGLVLPADAQFHVATEAQAASGQSGNFTDLFRGFLLTTILLWVSKIASLTVATLQGSWMPTFYYKLGGVPISQFATAQIFSVVGAALGMAAAGFVIDRFGARRVFVIFALSAAAMTIVLGFTPFGTALFPAVLFTWGFFASCVQGSLNALAPMAYPTSIRTTGVGWSLTASRAGSLIGAPIGAFMLAGRWNLSEIFIATAVPYLLVAVTGTLLTRSMDRRAAQEATVARVQLAT